MGKRKSRKVQSSGPAPKVDTVFDCPFCSHRETVEVKLNRRDAIGTLYCRICSVTYQQRMGPLTKEIDIYCDWIDKSEQLNSKKHKGFGLVEQSDEEESGNAKDDSSEDSVGFGAPKEIQVKKPEVEKWEELKTESNPESKVAAGGLGAAALTSAPKTEVPVKKEIVQPKKEIQAEDSEEKEEYDSEVEDLF